ncbi:MAG: hypothetical protein AAFV33_00855 [Chloroflexota bacterium]
MKLDRESYEHYVSFFADTAADDKQEAVRLAAFDVRAAVAYNDGMCQLLLKHLNSELPKPVSDEKLAEVVESIAAHNLKMLAIIEAARDYDSDNRPEQS